MSTQTSKTQADQDAEVFAAIKTRKPKTETVAIRVDADFGRRLAKLADDRGLSPSTLARMWLMEKMNQEAPLPPDTWSKPEDLEQPG